MRFDSILRWFRRPAKTSCLSAAEVQAKIDEKIQAHRDWQLQNEREAAEAIAAAVRPRAAKPDLQLLLANGRAAAQQLHGMQDDPAAPKPKPVPTKFTAQCGWCLAPFDREPRTPHQLEPLRQLLYIQGPQALVHIDICDTCYESVVGSAAKLNNNSSLDIGQSNSGPPNLLLQQAMR